MHPMRGWQKQATTCYASATTLAAEEVPTDAVCFHAQQACEKAVKALIAATGSAPQRTHDLTTLLNDALVAGWIVDPLRQPCEIVNPYSVTARYPGVHLDPSLDEARSCAATAESVVQIATGLIDATPPRKG